MPTVKKYPIIGGPLDGEYANAADFSPGYTSSNPRWSRPKGQFSDWRSEYSAYNNGAGAGGPSMVFLHRDLLRPVQRLLQ